MKTLFLIVLVLALASSSPAQTDVHSFASALEHELKGNAFMLRGFPLDSDLKFDSECNPEKVYRSGSWTEAELNVETVDVKGKNIVMTGRRGGFARLNQSGPLVRMIVPEENSVPGSHKIKVTIKGPYLGSPSDFVEKVKKRIFIMDINELGTLAPRWWIPYLRGDVTAKMKNGHPVYVVKEYGEPSEDSTTTTKIEPYGRLANGEPLYRVSKSGVTAPKPIKSPDPDYADAARAARYQGTMVLTAIVLKTGDIGDITIVSPLGMGLDDKAVEKVQTWKFDPALKDGAPVPVLINIEVTFRLY